MAGYSGTPLPAKLGIKPGSRVGLHNAPLGFAELLGVVESTEEIVDVLVAFYTQRTELEQQFKALGERVFPDGGLWIAWPKRASKLPTDIAENDLRYIILPSGLVDNKVCAIDETWSGLRFVWRKELRNR